MSVKPPATAAATAEAAEACVPGSFLTALKSADPGWGQQLEVANGCFGCHSLIPSQRMADPTWYGLAETSATRVAGQSAEQYLYTGIAQPNAYVVEGYQPNIMVQDYGQQLSEGDIADIVSYLLTLDGE